MRCDKRKYAVVGFEVLMVVVMNIAVFWELIEVPLIHMFILHCVISQKTTSLCVIKYKYFENAASVV